MKKKLTILFITLFLIPFLLISYASAQEIHYTYTFESENEGLLTTFNRTSNLRFTETWDTGNFDGEFSFDGQSGLFNDDIPFFDTFVNDPGTYASIEQSIDGHDDVLLFKDDSSSGYVDGEKIIGDFASLTFSLWVRSSNSGNALLINIHDNPNTLVSFALDNNEFWWHEPAGWLNFGTAVDNTWYHIKIEADPVTDTGNLWVNGVKLTNNAAFYEVGSAIDLVHFLSRSAEINSLYFDAIDIIDGIGAYNHSNIGSVKTQTNLYESDMYKFHMLDIDERLPTFGNFISGTLGWQTTIDSGLIRYMTSRFENPETQVIDSQNSFLSFYSITALTSQFIDRNYGARPTGEFEIHFEMMLRASATITSFGMYLFDFESDLILSILLINTAGTTYLRISNAITYVDIVAVNFFEPVIIDLNFNTEFKVFSVHSNVNGVDFYNILNSNLELDFYNIKFNLYSQTTGQSEAYLDNIGVYYDGESLDLSEMGYGEFYKIDLSEAEGSYAFDGYVHVGTTDPVSVGDGYIIENDFLTEVLALANQQEVIDLVDLQDSLIFTLEHGFPLNLIGNYDVIRLIENNGGYYLGTVSRGDQTSLLAHFEVIDGRLQGYNVDVSILDDWITISFDINDTETSNYTLVINDVYKTNWGFTTSFIASFTDGTGFTYLMDESEPFDVSGNRFMTDFGGILPFYKIIDVFSFNISSSIDNDGTSVLAGFDLIKLHYSPLGFIDLADLHSTGILAVMIPLVVLLLPTFAIYAGIENKKKGAGKKAFLPILLLISTILFATDLIPVWIYFIIVLGVGALIIVKRRSVK